ncbi:hypothetical protein F2P56_012233 [Juglans regia]|uniref:C-JID domain-containing protein n=1 Tax=Juglans regia TaxID=51240 RepID=A0A833XLD1_JUGRE|nr:hypothetical protein F2P56_012233 [Juglans regia]
MHDLLQEMGHEIIRRQSQGDPGKQSRLWLTNDIIRVLKNNSVTKRIEGIVLHSPPKKELQLNSGVFSKMKNLRLLKIIDEHGLTVLKSTRKPRQLKDGQRDILKKRAIQVYIAFSQFIPGGSRGVGIPMWFQNQSMGSSITIGLHPELDGSRKWLGYALYFSYEVKDLESWESRRFKRLHCEELVFRFVTDEGPHKDLLRFGTVPKFPTINMRAGFFLYVPRKWFQRVSKEVDTWSYIEVSITNDNPFMKVEKCGARLVYKQNAHEFVDVYFPSKKMTKNMRRKGVYQVLDDPWNLVSFVC